MLIGFGHLFRLARAGFILAREGVFKGVDPAVLPVPAQFLLRIGNLIALPGSGDTPQALVRAFAQIGPSYVKLGQFLATRPDVVGGEIADALTALQDRMEPFGRKAAVEIIERAFGKPVEEIFLSFGDPVAAASIAQVHPARVAYPQGERKVAVKVLRPDVERQFRRDLADMYILARAAERFSAEARRLRMIQVVDTLARSVASRRISVSRRRRPRSFATMWPTIPTFAPPASIGTAPPARC